MIADAEYLLMVANERLHLVADVKTSLLALEAADQRLRESGDPGVFKVRDALAKEINILKKSEAPDIVGLSSRLRAVEDLVYDMPLRLPMPAKAMKLQIARTIKNRYRKPRDGMGLSIRQFRTFKDW